MRHYILTLCLGLLLVGCQDEVKQNNTSGLLEVGEEFSAGEATINDESVNAFGHAAPNLTGDKDLLFVSGNSFFKRNWVTAPSSTEDLDGLGPLFNARSCSACHFKDGRAAPPLDARNEVGLLFRLSRKTAVKWEVIADDNYGEQFNPHAILGVLEEGKVTVSYEMLEGTYGDGKKYNLRKPTYHFSALNYGAIDDRYLVSPRISPHMVGLGLLEAIAEQDILALADENDTNKDGISGKPNYVYDIEKQSNQLGRFGWKANQPTVRQQVAGAFVGDIGITSSLFPENPCASNQVACNASESGGEPELTEKILDRVTLYSSAIAVPKRRNWDGEQVLKGKQLFRQMNCTGCHTEKHITTSNSDFPEFENQTIRPYTDLLLHDMGEGLADYRPDGLANGFEWKTPPLWGIGLIQVVNGHTFLLHDGRARGFEEAILWHGGEALKSKEAFRQLKESDREAVVAFLNSL